MSSQQLMITITSATDKPDFSTQETFKALLECGGHLTDSYVHTLRINFQLPYYLAGSWDVLG